MKVAVIGAGIYGKNHVNAYMHNANVELVCVCDRNEEVLREIESAHGLTTYREAADMFAVERLDAVSVATPDSFHVEPALLGIAHGVHVLVEKPLATSAADCRRIIRAAREKNVRVAVDFHKRWDPAAINVRNALRSEAAGAPIRGYMSMDDVIDVPTRWLSWAHTSSPAQFLGIHCYDQIRWYMGCEATEAYAVGAKKVLKSKGIDTYDSVQAMLTFENGCTWVVENGWIYPPGFPKANDGRTAILTECAFFRADSQNRGVELYDQTKGRTPNSYFISEVNGRYFGFGIEPIHDFVNCLMTGRDFAADAYDGLEAEKIAEAVHQSLAENRVVAIAREDADPARAAEKTSADCRNRENVLQ